MNRPTSSRSRQNWTGKTIHLFEVIEQLISIIIAVIVLLIVLIATLSVFKMTYELVFVDFISGSEISFTEFSKIFGRMITILIGLEFMNSILKVLKLRDVRVLASDVALISALAICRKLIIMDYGTYEPIYIFGLGFLILSLGLFYFLIRITTKNLRKADDHTIISG